MARVGPQRHRKKKTKDTDTLCIVFIGFTRQQWLRERHLTVTSHIHCPSRLRVY